VTEEQAAEEGLKFAALMLNRSNTFEVGKMMRVINQAGTEGEGVTRSSMMVACARILAAEIGSAKRGGADCDVATMVYRGVHALIDESDRRMTDEPAPPGSGKCGAPPPERLVARRLARDSAVDVDGGVGLIDRQGGTQPGLVEDWLRP
jgi:hypothetical protein